MKFKDLNLTEEEKNILSLWKMWIDDRYEHQPPKGAVSREQKIITAYYASMGVVIDPNDPIALMYSAFSRGCRFILGPAAYEEGEQPEQWYYDEEPAGAASYSGDDDEYDESYYEPEENEEDGEDEEEVQKPAKPKKAARPKAKKPEPEPEPEEEESAEGLLLKELGDDLCKAIGADDLLYDLRYLMRDNLSVDRRLEIYDRLTSRFNIEHSNDLISMIDAIDSSEVDYNALFRELNDMLNEGEREKLYYKIYDQNDVKSEAWDELHG